MKGRSLIVLVFAVLGIYAYIHWGIEIKEEKQKTADENEAKLVSGDLALLQHIAIESPASGPKIEIKKSGLGWRIVQPVQDLAAQNKIENLVSALERFKKTKVIIEAKDLEARKTELAQFGLDKPRIHLEYQISNLTPVEIFIGKQNPAATGSYAQIGKTGDVILATLELDFLGTQTPEDFREMKLLSVAPSDFSEVEFIYAGKKMKFVQDDAGQWKMTSPYSLPVDQDFTKGQMEKIGYLRANSFVEKAPAADSNADIKIVIGFKKDVRDFRSNESDKRPEGAEIVLTKIKKQTKQGKMPAPTDESFDYYAKGDKTDTASIARFHYDNFSKFPEDYVKKTFEDFSIADISSVTISKPGDVPLEVVKNGSGYVVHQGATEQPGNQAAVEKALDQLRMMRAVKFEETFKAPLASLFTVEVVMKDGTKRYFGFKFEKNAAFLWFAHNGLNMKYLTAKDPIQTADFTFKALAVEKEVAKTGGKTK